MTKSDHKCENCSDSKDERIKELQIKLTERNNEILILKDKLIENQRIVEILKDRISLCESQIAITEHSREEGISLARHNDTHAKIELNILQPILKGGKE